MIFNVRMVDGPSVDGVQLRWASRTTWGQQPPSNPNHGDMYLMTDFHESDVRVHMWTGAAWVEVVAT